MELSYNTQQQQIILSEYGRGVQEMVEHLKTIEDRDKRNQVARTITHVMLNLNPELKTQENYQQTVWDQLHAIGNYELDIDSDFPKPLPEDKATSPESLGYKAVLSRYRFYGRNLIEMINVAKNMDDGELKDLYLNYIASFMVNSSRNWNEEDLTPNQVVQHLADLSEGKLQVDPTQLNIHIEIRKKRPNTNFKKGKNNNNKKKSHHNRRR